ncbi:C39 family peptidase [Microtetraspora fusca]|uniref:C39 family peptidase n=1 Tax=Microtetraspora fusca TaxID=1997 RepID=UPI001FE10EA1|nr:C39 family peptidase [Microtetraspora fusca]
MSSVVLHRWSFEGQESGVAAYLDLFGPSGIPENDDGGGTSWPYVRWTSEEREIGFPATELVASWTANTPPGSWLQVELRARTATGALTKWYCMGRWAEGDADIHRTSLPGQGDQDGDVAVDTFVATRPVVAYQVRVTLYGAGGRVRSVNVMASAVPPGGPASAVSGPASTPANDLTAVQAAPSSLNGAHPDAVSSPRTAGVELNVPCRSQMLHSGHHPEWDGGGESWCSPASFSMVLGYWQRGPAPEDLAWVSPDDPCPSVDHAARHMYDHSYQGTGNWPFGVAYAGRYGLEGFVTRLRSVSELELFVCAGIPVITSQSFKEHELPGSGYSTSGHIMVVVGVTPTGDVIANDPAAPSDEAVRRIYPREAFENVWLRGSSSGGIVHVVHPPDVPLPLSEGNW